MKKGWVIFSLLLACSVLMVNGSHKAPPKNKVWEFEVDIPKMLRTLRSYTGVSVTGSQSQDAQVSPVARYGQPDLLSQKLKFEISSPGLFHIMDYVKNLVNVRRRQNDKKMSLSSFVDELQSAIKTPRFTTPPNYDLYRLSSLYKLAQERKKSEQ